MDVLELELVRAYREGLITVYELWDRLSPDRVMYVCLVSGIAFPTDGLIEELFPELNDDSSSDG